MSAFTGGGTPIASPLGSDSRPASVPVSGLQGRTSAPKDRPGRTSPYSPPGRGQAASSAGLQLSGKRIGRRQLAHLATQLGERDRAVLRRVAEHGFLTTIQIQDFCFAGHASSETAARTTRRVLRRLEGDGLLRSLPRRQGGVLGGSTPQTWQLSPAGSRLLAGDRDGLGSGSRVRSREPSLRWLRHSLAVADVHLAVLRHVRTTGGSATVSIEEAGWRSYSGMGGETRLLKPDLTADVYGEDEGGVYEDRWFIEVDCGTESLPTLLAKCRQYDTYYQTGIEQTDQRRGLGAAFPLVLWVFEHPERVERLQAALGRSPQLTPGMFSCTTHQQLADVLANPDVGGTS